MNDVLLGIVIGGGIGILGTVVAGVFDLIRANSLHNKEFEKKVRYENLLTKRKCYNAFLEFACWHSMLSISQNNNVDIRESFYEKTQALMTHQIEAMVDIRLYAPSKIAARCNLLMHKFNDLPIKIQGCTSMEELQKVDTFIAFCNEIEIIAELMKKDLLLENQKKHSFMHKK